MIFPDWGTAPDTAPEEALLPSPAEETQEPPLFAPPADFSAFSGF